MLHGPACEEPAANGYTYVMARSRKTQTPAEDVARAGTRGERSAADMHAARRAAETAARQERNAAQQGRRQS